MLSKIGKINLTNKIVKYLNKRPNCKAVNNHGNIYATNGSPNINVLDHGKHSVIFVGNKPNQVSKTQEKELYSWKSAGAGVLIIDSMEQITQHFP